MRQLAPQELADRARAETPVLLDVREPWEVALAAIDLPGCASLAIPMNEIPARLAELPADRTVVCVCHHGVRSQQVALFLERQGFDAVCNLSGGIDAWSARVDPTVPRY